MSAPTEDLRARLVAVARTARQRAYAPYSAFQVGAAALGSDGNIYAGANVENASYGLTVCAERVALWSAASAGALPVRQLALVTDTPQPVTPCGACRQVLAELAPDATVIMAALNGAQRDSTVADLLPDAFTGRDLERG